MTERGGTSSERGTVGAAVGERGSPWTAEPVWEMPCQRCGHVTMRYHGALPASREGLDWGRVRWLDNDCVVAMAAQADCPECGEQHHPKTFDPARWSEVKGYRPAAEMKYRPATHGHRGDSPFKRA